MNVCVIIPAAGASARFGASDKLSQDLGGRPLLMRTVEVFAKRDEVRSIVVAGPATSPEAFTEFRERYGPTLGFHGVTICEGGTMARWETVRNALSCVPGEATHIAVHDAARPGASSDLLDRLFGAARMHDAVVPAVPISATVKRVGEASDVSPCDEDDVIADLVLGDVGRTVIETRPILETVDRSNLVEVQTPQVFAVDLLRRAYAQADLSGATDDASLVERLGEPVLAVPGEARNFKITVPDDLTLMRNVLGLSAPAERPVHKRF